MKKQTEGPVGRTEEYRDGGECRGMRGKGRGAVDDGLRGRRGRDEGEESDL